MLLEFLIKNSKGGFGRISVEHKYITDFCELFDDGEPVKKQVRIYTVEGRFDAEITYDDMVKLMKEADERERDVQ